MKMLQLDAEYMEYELIKPESKIYEKSDKKSERVENALVLLVSIEDSDNPDIVGKAAAEAVEFAKKQKIKDIVAYPFAHLSDNLADPNKALELIVKFRKDLEHDGLKVHSAPFGWNKKWDIKIKGHPLAEQSRSYGAAPAPQQKRHRKVDLSIVKKSEWTGLPEKDHRNIGESLDLYSFQEVSPSMVYWHPNGRIIYQQLIEFMRGMERLYDYKEISTPALANIALWHVSGHIDYYKDNMFIVDDGSSELGLKPMNCPSTILIYKSRRWSYKELPFRTAIFDKLYRREVSGALSGLFRVQELTQDDGHIFVSAEGVEKEITLLLELVKKVYGVFGLKYYAKLSTMPDEHLGDEELWVEATESIKRALESNGMKYEIKEKEGAFYGPKIDFDIEDSQGRLWQCATIQLDYQLPRRFGIVYTGEDGKEHTPVIIHRAILGSIERFVGIMVEHYQGKLPLWLSPVQARVISISEENNRYAESVFEKIKLEGIRAEMDGSDHTLEYKIRSAQMQKIPYIVVIGNREREKEAVSVRMRSGKQENGIKLEHLLESIKKEISERAANE
jgi:threonyl-tRNA synthetase